MNSIRVGGENVVSEKGYEGNGMSGGEFLLDRIKRYMDLAVDIQRSGNGQWQMYESFAVDLVEVYWYLVTYTTEYEDEQFYMGLRSLVREYPNFHDLQKMIKTLVR